MTLGEVIARRAMAGKTLTVGDYEIVEGPDGLGHMVVVTFVHKEQPKPEYDFMCPCMAFPRTTDMNEVVIAPFVTCLDCSRF